MPDGVTLSEDELGMVSPAMFDRFFLPRLARMAERYGALGIHGCANARHQWPGFQRIPGLRLLNLCQPDDVVRDAYGVFTPQVAHMHLAWTPEGDETTWMDGMPEGARCVFSNPHGGPAEPGYSVMSRR